MRKTPGMAAIGSRRLSPSTMKIGQIRSSTLRPVFLHQAARPVGLAHAPQAARLPVISSTLRWPAPCVRVNLFMPDNLLAAGS